MKKMVNVVYLASILCVISICASDYYDTTKHVVIVNATQEPFFTRVDWGNTDQGSVSVPSNVPLNPGELVVYGPPGMQGGTLANLFVYNKKDVSIAAAIGQLTGGVYGGFFVIQTTGQGYVLTGPLKGRFYIEGITATGTLYLVNALGYDLKYHVGYKTLFCSSDDKLLFAGQIKELDIGACNTDNIHALVLDNVGRETNKYSGSVNNGIFVFLPGKTAGTYLLDGPWNLRQ